jgi:hypothetical protein
LQAIRQRMPAWRYPNYRHTGSSYAHARRVAGQFGGCASGQDVAAKEKSMAQDIKHFQDEADIGSGEKTSAQKEVEREQQSLEGTKATEPLERNQEKQPMKNREEEGESSPPGRILRSGTHLARILAVAVPNHTFEAQVYVRLTREPEVAETYIPAGIFATEEQAWAAAEERARRAFEEHEF